MAYRNGKIFACAALIFVAAACTKDGNQAAADRPSMSKLLSGGDATIFDQSSRAYASPLPGLTDEQLAKHQSGDALFGSKFVTAPSPVHPGLGPLYNNNQCEACHTKDGRGSPVLAANGLGSQLLVFVSQPSGAEVDPDGPKASPDFGLQVRDQAVFGHTPKATLALEWTEESGKYPDGTAFSLRRPKLSISLVTGKALPKDLEISARQPTAVFGLGLLEAVDEETLTALASDSGKVPGHANSVWSRANKTDALGRFGRKAGKASLREQAAKAFALDMGLTNELFPEGASGTSYEITADDLDTLAFYLRTLAVPSRRKVDDATVVHGEELFHSIGCNGCHVSEITTGDSDVVSLAHQTIHPYSDLLLHDMGPDLADGRAEFKASGSEWRTAALWGIGLVQTVHPYAAYLHDGRARSLQEAILWHGGQAAPYNEAFQSLPSADRNALVAFLESL